MNLAAAGVEWSVMGGRSRQGFGPGSDRNSPALPHPAIPLEGPPPGHLHRDRVAAEEPSNLTRHGRGHEPIGSRVGPRRVK
jgi:hypothetical protein